MKKSKIPKSEQKRPKMALKVSSNLALFLTKKPYKKDQLHVDMSRLIQEIENHFYTFEYLYKTDLIDQETKNKLFPYKTVIKFLQLFTTWDYENTEHEEQVKLRIITSAIRDSLSYLEHRYRHVGLIKKQAQEFKELLNTIEVLAQTKADERKAIEFYKLRNKMLLPPDLHQYETQYVAMCRICWEHYLHDDKQKAINHIRHKKQCFYDKSSRCFEVIPPIKQSKITK